MADATGRSTTEGPLRPYRNHLVAQQVPVRFAGTHPTFGGTCGDPPGDHTPEMNENGLRTQVASRAGSVLGVFGAKNHRKSVQRRNATNFGVRGLHGHCGPCKKMIDFGGCDGETYDRGSPPPIPKPLGCTASASAVCRNAPKFLQRVWGPAQGPHARD